MSKVETVVKTINEKLSLSRRGFMKGMLAVGATASLYGCSKGDDTEILGEGDILADTNLPASDPYANVKSTFRYGTSGHNCGGRCAIKAQVVDGRIVRFLTDDSKVDYEGNTFELDGRNSTQSRACAKCRGYKGRLYHPGRLRYPLKQTKKRGDLSGFQRISWGQAFKDISDRLKAVTDEYGVESFNAIYACGSYLSSYQGGSYTGVFRSVSSISDALKLLGGASPYASDYSFHQGSFFSTRYTGYAGTTPSADQVAEHINNIVLWGSNIVSTVNPSANPWIKSTQDMKKRNPNAKVWYIGPEMSDTGISMADEWIQIKPSTDNALIMAIIYELIATNKLDVDYLDTMVYGFCDSPAYSFVPNGTGYFAGTNTSRGTSGNNSLGVTGTINLIANNDWKAENGIWWINNTSGEVRTTAPSPTTGWTSQSVRWQNNTTTTIYAYTEPVRNVDAVPAGRSLMSYVLGNGNLPAGADATKWANYSASSTNYVAKQFATGTPVTRYTACRYIKPTNTKYQTKLDYQTPKTPEWASAITGVSPTDIRRLASFFAKAGDEGQQILNCWSGGQLKQAEGCYTLFAMQTLNILVKNWGIAGADVIRNAFTRNSDPAPKTVAITSDDFPLNRVGIPTAPETPVLSCTMWHNAVKVAFGDNLTEGNIPDFTAGIGKPYFDDGGAKSAIKWARSGTSIKTFSATQINGINHTFNKWDKGGADATETDIGSDTGVKFSGYRFILNTGGNIPLNQHANAIDSMKMYEQLPTFGYQTGNVEMKDAFYLVTFDNFMAPSARYSDYVLPAKTTWEQADFGTYTAASGGVFIDEVIDGPGESKSTWDFARDLIEAHKGRTEATKFASNMDDFKTIFKKGFNANVRTKPTSAFYGKTWEEFLEKPFVTAKPNITPTATPTKSTDRVKIEEYLAGDKILPFTKTISASNPDSIGFGGQFSETETCPKSSGRFHVYSGAMVWQYENRYSKWHGYLPAEKRGQMNVDLDGLRDGVTTNFNTSFARINDGYQRVLPIPMYFAYQDYYMEAYGLYSTVTKSTDVQTDYPFQLTTTHDKFRAHSSQSENPYLRELTHMAVGGKAYSGHDANTYALSFNPDTDKVPPLNSLIDADGKGDKNAAYSEILLNPEDASGMGIVDGDLLQVENPIGAVRVVARLTNRCVKGFVGLHQGCWFDPRNIGNTDNASGIVDVGGNCNTLMASQPSRLDHGNAQQSALVKITKVATA